jgi:hypothetical protein
MKRIDDERSLNRDFAARAKGRLPSIIIAVTIKGPYSGDDAGIVAGETFEFNGQVFVITETTVNYPSSLNRFTGEYSMEARAI